MNWQLVFNIVVGIVVFLLLVDKIKTYLKSKKARKNSLNAEILKIVKQGDTAYLLDETGNKIPFKTVIK